VFSVDKSENLRKGLGRTSGLDSGISWKITSYLTLIRPASEVAVDDLTWECMMYEMDEARANAIAGFRRDAKSRDPLHASRFLE
jgi:hypothetical protein